MAERTSTRLVIACNLDEAVCATVPHSASIGLTAQMSPSAFSASCGTAISLPPTLKVMPVVFTNIASSGGIGTSLTPETAMVLSELSRAAFRRSAPTTRYGGALG
jgi:hypothetical protein